MEEAERQEREATAAAAALEFERGGSSSTSPTQAHSLQGPSQRYMPGVMPQQSLHDVYHADAHRLQQPHWVSIIRSVSRTRNLLHLDLTVYHFKLGLRRDSNTTIAPASPLALSDQTGMGLSGSSDAAFLRLATNSPARPLVFGIRRERGSQSMRRSRLAQVCRLEQQLPFRVDRGDEHGIQCQQ